MGRSLRLPEGTDRILVHVTANAYLDPANDAVLAIFKSETDRALLIVSKPVKARAVYFDEYVQVLVPDMTNVGFDIRMGPERPGVITINGPANGGPPKDVPYPTLTISEIQD